MTNPTVSLWQLVECDVIEYAKGVLVAEVPRTFHIEAQKAQVVAIVSYALAQAELWPDSRSQNFRPDWRRPESDAIVEEMAGVVGVRADGQAATMYYSAYCGGITRGNVANVPWLRKDVPCPCAVADNEAQAAYNNAHWVYRQGKWLKGGHRSGLCQHGADALARHGWDWRRILAHYYDVTLRRDFGAAPLEEG